jgi:hypothetical protein
MFFKRDTVKEWALLIIRLRSVEDLLIEYVDFHEFGTKTKVLRWPERGQFIKKLTLNESENWRALRQLNITGWAV